MILNKSAITQELLGIKTIVIEFMKIIGKYTSPILSAQRNTTGTMISPEPVPQSDTPAF